MQTGLGQSPSKALAEPDLEPCRSQFLSSVPWLERKGLRGHGSWSWCGLGHSTLAGSVMQVSHGIPRQLQTVCLHPLSHHIIAGYAVPSCWPSSGIQRGAGQAVSLQVEGRFHASVQPKGYPGQPPAKAGSQRRKSSQANLRFHTFASELWLLWACQVGCKVCPLPIHAPFF